ncbi:MAG TPA: tetraacyldisaccharide 4'-kinase [Acidobacteriaceae bacterium]
MSARRPWARPLVPLYAAAVAMKDALRQAALLRTRRLRWPVVSVGSLSAGGAGKTPVVIALAKLLQEMGQHVDVLTRGYGRQGRGVEQVEPDVDLSAKRFGDEPLLIARQTKVPVWVGGDRFEAGERAEAEAGESQRGVHLLDDGFQHRQLARTIDIVLVTGEDLNDSLLPAGNLREGLSALQRADVVVVREDEFEVVGKRVWARVREGAQMWTVRRTLRFPAPLFVFGAGLRPVAFCAIARPEGFAAMLQEAGCGIVETVAFGDHHRYSMADVERVIEVAKGLNGSGFVTTEKDAVKLTASMRERLERVGPLMVVSLEAVFPDSQAVMRALEAKLVAAKEQA